MGDIYTNPPQSRNEAILRATIDGTEYTAPPQSRIEDLLIELKEAIEGGGGTTVEANPAGEVTGGELGKLKVGSDIYSVVTKAVNDLANYYTKSEVYTKTEVNNIAQARFAVVAELPTQDIQTNVIYLVPKSTAQTNNKYDEYIYALQSTNPDVYGWEKIGDTEIDLSDYVTTSALNTALADYTTTTDLTTLLAGKQNTLTFDTTPTAQSTNPVTSGGIKSYVDGQGAKTVSGNPITLTDAEGMNADHVVATITPTQTGSGTSSPSNVRPFVGFSSVDVPVNGKNLLRNGKHTIDASTVFIGYIDDNNYESFLKANTTYTLSVSFSSGYNYNNLRIYTAERNGQQSYLLATGKTQISFTVNEDGYYRFWLFNQGSLTESNILQFQLEVGDQATTYEPYQGQTYTVQLGDTYYGATLDVTSGKLRANYAKATVTGINQSTSNIFWQSLNNAKLNDYEVLCDKIPTMHNYGNPGVKTDEWGSLIVVTSESYSSASDFMTAYDGEFNVCYELATPIEIQLTPQQIALLENNNTITTNVSSIDITYQTNTAIGDTASALDKRVTRLESKVPQPPTTDGTYKLTVTVASGEPTYSWESAT